MIRILKALVLALCFPAFAQAAVIYSSWTSNEGYPGNYVLTVTEVSGNLAFDLTVDPWNAEALGLFVDLGDYSLTGAASLLDVSPSGQVSIFATDTTSNGCGPGCNLNGLFSNSTQPEWDFVFRLGSQGFQGIQSYSFTLSVVGTSFSESDLGIVGIRAQQLCKPGYTLDDGDGNCKGSDKSYGYGVPSTPPPSQVPAPGTLALLGLGLLGLAGWRRLKA